MKTGLSLRMGQSLAMTPALQQAIRMLQLSSQDLQIEIAQALDQNYMLEAEDAPTATAETDAAPSDNDSSESSESEAATEGLDGLDEAWGADSWSSGGTGDNDWYDYQQANLHSGTDLREHLAWQANLCTLQELPRSMLAYLIDAVTDDGYLHDWPQLCAQFPPDGEQAAALEEALATLQSFEPAGVGARDAVECLRLQLQQPELEDDYDSDTLELARRIITQQMDLLARRETDRLPRALDASQAQVDAALRCIRSLSPHPGRAYSAQPEEYVVPDVITRCVNGRWQVQLNPDSAPRVRINPAYAALIRRSERSGEQQSMRQHLQEAKQIMAALRARHDTLIRVARCIVEQQTGFMEHGPEHMCPLVLREVAEKLGVHESTVSRATANKYMLTPMGVFELKYFFSSSVRTTKGGSASATAIQARIKRLIQSEPAGKPLSDAKLSELLLQEGMEVARRTVAKYREGLGIPPAHERRRMA